MRTLYITIIAALMFAGTGATAQNRPGGGEDWMARMMSEKIAFLSIEIGLSPEEAQKFWPVYNEVNKEKDEAIRNVFKTFMELEKAVAAKRPEKEISKLLDKYNDALETQKNVDVKAIEKFRKVLSENQVAKLYIGEEKLRRQQIRRLHPRPGL